MVFRLFVCLVADKKKKKRAELRLKKGVGESMGRKGEMAANKSKTWGNPPSIHLIQTQTQTQTYTSLFRRSELVS